MTIRPVLFEWLGDGMRPFGSIMARRCDELTLSDPEFWVVIEDFSAYAISSHGRVRRIESSRILSHRPLPLGHLQCTLSMGDKPTTRLVHRMVGAAFLPPAPDGKDCVLHRDDTPAHNWPANLFWGDRRDNSDDKVSKGRQAKGEIVAGAKLTNAAVVEIRSRCGAGADQYDIAAKYGVTQSNISMIVNRVTWKHVP